MDTTDNTFKVGDRVVLLNDEYICEIVGKEATVIEAVRDFFGGISPYCAVEFDEPFVGGYDCGGKGKKDCCRYVDCADLALLKIPEFTMSFDDII